MGYDVMMILLQLNFEWHPTIHQYRIYHKLDICPRYIYTLISHWKRGNRDDRRKLY